MTGKTRKALEEQVKQGFPALPSGCQIVLDKVAQEVVLSNLKGQVAGRWQDMVQETTAGDPAIKAALKKLWDEQGDSLAAQHGSQYDPRPVFGYITTANEAMTQK